MLEMILDPCFLVDAPRKFAALEKNVAAPSAPFIVVDARALVTALLLGKAARHAHADRGTNLGADHQTHSG